MCLAKLPPETEKKSFCNSAISSSLMKKRCLSCPKLAKSCCNVVVFARCNLFLQWLRGILRSACLWLARCWYTDRISIGRELSSSRLRPVLEINFIVLNFNHKIKVPSKGSIYFHWRTFAAAPPVASKTTEATLNAHTASTSQPYKNKTLEITFVVHPAYTKQLLWNKTISATIVTHPANNKHHKATTQLQQLSLLIQPVSDSHEAINQLQQFFLVNRIVPNNQILF